MDKAMFLAVLTGIVEAFEDPAFKQAMADAKASGDVGKMIAVPAEAQNRVFSANGLDPATASDAFKAAGKQYAADADVMPFIMRMRAAMGK